MKIFLNHGQTRGDTWRAAVVGGNEREARWQRRAGTGVCFGSGGGWGVG